MPVRSGVRPPATNPEMPAAPRGEGEVRQDWAPPDPGDYDGELPLARARDWFWTQSISRPDVVEGLPGAQL